jgi:hypothetical protein
MLVIKSRRMMWMEHSTCTVEIRNAHKILILKLEQRRHLEVLGTDGILTVRWM